MSGALSGCDGWGHWCHETRHCPKPVGRQAKRRPGTRAASSFNRYLDYDVRNKPCWPCMNALQPTETLAVLTLSETGEILAARDACLAVFGREVGALIGVNIRVLLKGGLDNEIGRLLHGHRTGKNPTDSAPLHVAALRKDCTEFTACATTRKWNSEAA